MKLQGVSAPIVGTTSLENLYDLLGMCSILRISSIQTEAHGVESFLRCCQCQAHGRRNKGARIALRTTTYLWTSLNGNRENVLGVLVLQEGMHENFAVLYSTSVTKYLRIHEEKNFSMFGIWLGVSATTQIGNARSKGLGDVRVCTNLDQSSPVDVQSTFDSRTSQRFILQLYFYYYSLILYLFVAIWFIHLLPFHNFLVGALGLHESWYHSSGPSSAHIYQIDYSSAMTPIDQSSKSWPDGCGTATDNNWFRTACVSKLDIDHNLTILFMYSAV